MSKAVTKQQPGPNFAAIEQILIGGDLSKLSEEQRVAYYNKVCETLGLNPLTRPFEYIRLNGKLVLYATKGCAEQLRQIHAISIRITARETIEGIYVVTAQAERKSDDRVDEDTGAVPIAGLRGDALANAMLKATTKAKRRVTLSICGLNMLDETEVEAIKPVVGERLVVPEQPAEGDGVQDMDVGYRIPFGKFQKRALEEVPIEQLRSYVEYLEKAAKKQDKAIEGVVKDFIERAEAHIAAFEITPFEVEAEEVRP